MTVPMAKVVGSGAGAVGTDPAGGGAVGMVAGDASGAGVVAWLRSSALTMRRPAAAARAAAPARVRPASEGMRKAWGDSPSSGSLSRRLTRGLSTPAALGLGVWAMTMPGSPDAGT